MGREGKSETYQHSNTRFSFTKHKSTKMIITCELYSAIANNSRCNHRDNKAGPEQVLSTLLPEPNIDTVRYWVRPEISQERKVNMML